MTYTADHGEVSARSQDATTVEQHTLRGGTIARFTATGSLTGGRFGLYEWHMKPHSGGPSAHFHKTFAESFYVISGAVCLYDGADWTDAGPGDFKYVPEGGIHAFRNDSDQPASMLILFTPGIARETYFRELADIAATGRTLTGDEWAGLFAQHDQYRAQ
ncbi:MAG TPA: cupin domain-containing protein [Trebonia sp.]|jgi:quercetin dioxygenase-like cupin family protein|nr:cupin domain-containing protein [Trebonia sp.]